MSNQKFNYTELRQSRINSSLKYSSLNIQLTHDNNFCSVARIINLITSNSDNTKIAIEIEEKPILPDSYVIFIFSFSIALRNKEVFDIIRTTYPNLGQSISAHLGTNVEEFSFRFFIEHEWERNYVLNEVIIGLINSKAEDYALQLIEHETHLIIFFDLLEFLGQANNFEFINKLLNKANIKFASSRERGIPLLPLMPIHALPYYLLNKDNETIIDAIRSYQIPLNENVIELIADSNKFELLHILGVYNNPTPETLLSAFKFNSYDYLITNNTYLLDYISSRKFPKLIEALVNSSSSFEDIELKLFLIKTCIRYFKQDHSRTLLKNFEYAIVGKLKERPNIFDYTYNPIKLSVLIIELVVSLGKKYRVMQVYSKKIKDELMEYASSVNSALTNEESLRLLYLEEDFEGREVLFTIQKLKLYTMMEDNRIKVLVKTLWDSNYSLSGGFMSTSYLYRLLIEWPINSKLDVESEMRWKRRDVNKIPNNSLNFNAWKKGIGWRHMTQISLYFALAIFFQVLIYMFLNEGESFIKKEDSKLAKKIYNDFNFFLRCSFIWFTFIIKVIFDYAFRVRAKRNYRFFSGELLMLLFQMICTIFIIRESGNIKRKCNNQYKVDVYTCFCREFFRGEASFLKEFLSLMMLIIWMRVIFSLRITKLLGPLITSITLMTKNLIEFLLFFGLFNIACGCLFSLLLIQIEEFRNPFKAMYTLYMASMLLFDSEIIEEGGERTRLYAHIFIIIYLFIAAISLLNLFIAVIIATYNNIEKKSKILYLTETIKLRPIYKYDKRHSYYVSAAFPFTVILISVLPFMLFGEQMPDINNVMLHLEYLPFMMFVVFLFVVISLILLPFVYLKIVLHKFLLIFKRNKVTVIRKIWRFIVYMLLGLIFLVVQVISDCILFICHLYSDNLEKLLKDRREVESFDLNTLEDFISFLQNMKEEIGNTEVIIDDLFKKYEGNLNTRNIELNEDEDNLKAIRQVLTTQEYDKEEQRLIDLNAAYCLLKSILNNWTYFEIIKDTKHPKRNAILNNINRRIVCQQEEQKPYLNSNSD